MPTANLEKKSTEISDKIITADLERRVGWNVADLQRQTKGMIKDLNSYSKTLETRLEYSKTLETRLEQNQIIAVKNDLEFLQANLRNVLDTFTRKIAEIEMYNFAVQMMEQK